MNAVFELLHEQTNAHRLVRAPNRRARSARRFSETRNRRLGSFFFRARSETDPPFHFFFLEQPRIAHDGGLVCKSWHRDAAETLLRDTAVSGRGARRFARAAARTTRMASRRRRRRRPRRGFDDRSALRARRESGSAVSGNDSDAPGEGEFSSKRRRVETGGRGRRRERRRRRRRAPRRRRATTHPSEAEANYATNLRARLVTRSTS